MLLNLRYLVIGPVSLFFFYQTIVITLKDQILFSALKYRPHKYRIVSNCGPWGQDLFLRGPLIKNTKMLNLNLIFGEK